MKNNKRSSARTSLCGVDAASSWGLGLALMHRTSMVVLILALMAVCWLSGEVGAMRIEDGFTIGYPAPWDPGYPAPETATPWVEEPWEPPVASATPTVVGCLYDDWYIDREIVDEYGQLWFWWYCDVGGVSQGVRLLPGEHPYDLWN